VIAVVTVTVVVGTVVTVVVTVVTVALPPSSKALVLIIAGRHDNDTNNDNGMIERPGQVEGGRAIQIII